MVNVANTFPMDNYRREWTQGEAYKKWVRALKQTKRVRRSVKKDLCAGTRGICRGNLGIRREYMPQFTLRRAPFSKRPIQKFRQYIKTKYGIRSYPSTRRAADLKPTQSEISRARVEDLIEDKVVDTMEVPLVVSSNGYVVDGHHRWAAFRMEAPKRPMKVIVVDAPVKDVLGMAVDWGAPSHQF
jgi:hypothetical protein